MRMNCLMHLLARSMENSLTSDSDRIDQMHFSVIDSLLLLISTTFLWFLLSASQMYNKLDSAVGVDGCSDDAHWRLWLRDSWFSSFLNMV